MDTTLETVAGGGLLIGLCAYSALVAFFIYGWTKRISGRAALIASTLTAASGWVDASSLITARAQSSARPTRAR